MVLQHIYICCPTEKGYTSHLIPMSWTYNSLENSGRLGTPKSVGYQTTKILAEVKIMYHVKMRQDLCASALRQVLSISVTCGCIYITAQHSAGHYGVALSTVFQFISQGGLSTNWIYFESN